MLAIFFIAKIIFSKHTFSFYIPGVHFTPFVKKTARYGLCDYQLAPAAWNPEEPEECHLARQTFWQNASAGKTSKLFTDRFHRHYR